MCTQKTSGVLVVVEGARRLQWERAGSAWRLAGCWPSPQERTEVAERLERDQPLLVVVEPGSQVVPALVEEVDALPESVRVLDRDSDVLDLEVAAFDWLPEHVRARGERFVAEATAALRSTPLSALPPLLIEPSDEASCGVRFAVRTPACRDLSAPLVHDAAVSVFPGRTPLAA